jgi:hypothetical protein
MLNPYRVIDETETHVTYEYRPAFSWVSYGLIVLIAVGVIIRFEQLAIGGAIALAAYLAIKLPAGKAVTAVINKAMQTNTVQMSGNKSSFRNPLRIRVPK